MEEFYSPKKQELNSLNTNLSTFAGNKQIFRQNKLENSIIHFQGWSQDQIGNIKGLTTDSDFGGNES